MTEPTDSSDAGGTAGPFLGALTIIVAIVIAVWLFNDVPAVIVVGIVLSILLPILQLNTAALG